MKKLILAALSAAMSLPLLAASQSTTTSTTSDTPTKVKEVTTTTTTREETPVSGEQFSSTLKQSMEESPATVPAQNMEESPATIAPSTQSSGNAPQMEEAAPSNELSSPSVAPTTDPSFQLNEQKMEDNTSFQSAPWEKEKIQKEDEDEGEEDEYVPNRFINDEDEEEEY